MAIATNDTSDLRKRAILVRVDTKILGTQKKDKEATAKAAADYSAKEDQVFVGKSIINKKNPLYKRIDKIKGQIRNTHVSLTGPWQDDGFRIIAAKRYSTWAKTIEEMQLEFYDAVDQFVKSYDDLKSEAKQNLGTLYDEDLYPSADGIRDSFIISTETEVLPDRTNTIIDLDTDRTNKIVKDALANDAKRVASLTNDTHERVADELTRMIDSLTEYGDEIDGSKRSRTFRNTLVKRIAGLADTLPGLNVTGDPRLDKLAKDISAKLTKVSVEDLRGDKKPGDNRTDEQRHADAADKREQVAAAATDIANDLANVFGAA
tara:strand:- start:309 stop:1265 length:957 start_codon:yes stop_codon:yes gene_type:complete